MNLYTISFLILLIYNTFKSKDSLYNLQQNQYNENNYYLKWLSKHLKRAFVSLDFISLIIIIIAYLLNNRLSNVLVFISLIIYLLANTFIVNTIRLSKEDKNLVMTKRVKRLIFTLVIIYLIPIIIYLNNKDDKLLFILVEAIITYLNYITVLLAKIINIPLEKIIYNYYEAKAIDKLSSMKNLKVIGITGSYGKTSAKSILYDILNEKFVSRSTLRSINTENGILKTINSHIESYDEVFIAEMGAYKQGKIRKMANIIKPKYAILTSIGLAHIDSFKSPENIKKTKFELVESLPSDGIAILNMDDNNQTSYNIKNKCRKVWISIYNKDADVYATNITNNYEGAKFDVVFKDSSNRYHVETKLLGNYNIYNILASIILAKELGMTQEEIEKAVKKVKAPRGRLELVDLDYMVQINDFFNSNPLGAKMALDVLDTMPGIKIVVTPGMTDLGNKTKQLNHIFGNQIADVADCVILIGSKKTRQVFDGILEKGYDKDKIFIVNNVDSAYNLLQTLKFDKKIYALFENNAND